MIPESRPLQRPPEARLLVIDAAGRMRQVPRADFVTMLRRGDLAIANDAATLPASLHGNHVTTGAAIELRLAGWPSAILDDPRRFHAIVFGAGDYRQRTEDRSPPPLLQPGDRLALGPLSARIEALLGHPRLVAVDFEGTRDSIWAGLARHGRPIQYAHVPTPLALWDVWTPIAGPPVAFEPPSAGFALDWRSLGAMRARGVVFATLTHAAGISSTGDPALDNLVPFDEPYSIPAATASAIRAARAHGGRIIRDRHHGPARPRSRRRPRRDRADRKRCRDRTDRSRDKTPDRRYAPHRRARARNHPPFAAGRVPRRGDAAPSRCRARGESLPNA